MQLVQPAGALPDTLKPRLELIATRLAELDLDAPEAIAATAARVTVVSEFTLGVLLRQADALIERLLEPEPLSAASVVERIDIDGLAEAQAMAALRRFRQVELARIAWRDLSGWADLPTTIEELSALADGMIRAAVRYAAASLAPRFGLARHPDGRAAELLVLAMGKLGGRELNYSSDIDIVFLFPDETVIDGSGTAEPEAYFRRLAQLVIKLLDQATADGFVFRVDTRLRPFGASGPLAVSVSAFESYLTRHGRDWERYAYVKARLVTGLEHRTELFDEILTPYVYRRYLDYGVFDALRQMQKLISEEVQRKDMAQNIKLGPGGIREIEFIVQAFQLVRGGRDPSLQSPSLLTVLPRVAADWLQGEQIAAQLRDAYVYLRTVENRLQAMEDRQTQVLPDDAERRERLAYAMQASWPELVDALDRRRRLVQSEFNRIAWETRGGAAAAENGGRLRGAWESGSIEQMLADSRLSEDEEAVRLLGELRGGGLYRRMDEPSRQRLAETVSRIVPLLEERATPGLTLRRLLPLLQAICRRSAYLALLNENPQTLERLLSLVEQSPLLARQLAEHPLLLDELLDPRLFDEPPSRQELHDSLQEAVRHAEPGDMESAIDAIRQFQRAAVFRIAVADRFGHLPLMRVSDRLTDTAELVLEFALETAWVELVAKHGRPMCGEPPNLKVAEFCIVGYGKLGGLELGYGSDLDLVFLHDCTGPLQQTDGPRPIDNARFFSRLVQRIVHFLTIQTSSGRLYEVDMRLRPDGSSGLIVTSLENFHRYQRHDAWPWEHQALLRSRAVAGSEAVRAAFEQERLDVLINHVKRDRLKQEVRQMRDRMRTELSRGGTGEFDIKQDPGGLADIEFLVDYWVLANAREYPQLVEFPDKLRQLEGLERVGLVTPERRRSLERDYLTLRQRLHELALNDQARVVDASEFAELRARIRSLWDEEFA